MVQVVVKEEFHKVRLLGALEVSLFGSKEFLNLSGVLSINRSLILLAVEEWAFKAFEALRFFTRLRLID
jgi:hypothetical protein